MSLDISSRLPAPKKPDPSYFEYKLLDVFAILLSFKYHTVALILTLILLSFLCCFTFTPYSKFSGRWMWVMTFLSLTWLMLDRKLLTHSSSNWAQFKNPRVSTCFCGLSIDLPPWGGYLFTAQCSEPSSCNRFKAHLLLRTSHIRYFSIYGIGTYMNLCFNLFSNINFCVAFQSLFSQTYDWTSKISPLVCCGICPNPYAAKMLSVE